MTDRASPALASIFDAAVAAAHPDVVLAKHLPEPPRSGDLPRRRQGRRRDGGGGRAALSRHAHARSVAPDRHCHHPPRPRRADAADQGHRGRSSRARRGRAESRRRDACSLRPRRQRDDLLLVLLSGGGSANWIAPVEGVSFAQKQQVNRALLRSGAPIGEINTVRKHLSRIKGGRLARAGRAPPRS